jgi:hypothetical protein
MVVGLLALFAFFLAQLPKLTERVRDRPVCAKISNRTPLVSFHSLEDDYEAPRISEASCRHRCRSGLH